jgi:hypothetical protein
MEMSQGNSLCSHLKQTKIPFFSFIKLENRRAEQVLSGGLVPVGEGRKQGKGIGENLGQICVHMCINGKMIFVETIQGMVGRGIKENDGGDELKYDVFDILIVRTLINATMYPHPAQ